MGHEQPTHNVGKEHEQPTHDVGKEHEQPPHDVGKEALPQHCGQWLCGAVV